ncbi:terminase large subunit [Gordonia phage Marteena]|nr:terminase large subunit [Gordonia phage EMsquaredA]QDP45087.1 terminase large subunit [Gordonia phage Marteena]
MTTATSDQGQLPPGYWVDPESGAWCSIPWPTDPAERQRIAESSLGPLIIRWAENRLTDDEFEEYGPGLIHYQTGEPWRFTRGQKRFLVLWYHYTPQGRFVFRSGVKRGAKGTGKDPFGGAHCNIELAGPSQLVSDGADGWAGVAHRMPLVQISSNSEEQSKDMLRVANAMWSNDAREWHDLDCGETRTILKGRGRLEVLTASEASSEGDPATFIALNESHHMTESSGGHRVTAVARRNVGKSPKTLQARLCEYTNAHTQGSDSTAERSYESWQDQVSGRFKNMRKDILYDSIEADPNLDMTKLPELRKSLVQAYSDAPWADLDRLEAEILDSRTSVAETIRFYFNGLGAAEDAWVDPGKFDTLSRPAAVVADGDQIAMFLDCSKSEDATGLVGCRLIDGHVFVLGLWQRPRGDRGKGWLAPRHEVDAKVRETFTRYRVEWFGVDPSPARDDEDEALYWAELIDQWHRDFGRKLKVWATPGANIGHAVKFDMRLSQRGAVDRNRAFTEMSELVIEWVDERPPDAPPSFTHDGDAGLRLHTQHAKRRPNQWGVSLGKESRDSKKLVDLAVCMVGALMGRRIVLNSNKVRVGARKKRKVVLA